MKFSVRQVHPIVKHATFICPLNACDGTRKIQGSMLVISADVYDKSLDSVYFHIPFDVYSCDCKCNTYPLFTSAFTQSVGFSRK